MHQGTATRAECNIIATIDEKDLREKKVKTNERAAFISLHGCSPCLACVSTPDLFSGEDNSAKQPFFFNPRNLEDVMNSL